MKVFYSIFIFLFVTNSLSAQVKTVFTDIDGDFSIEINIQNNGTVTVNQYGEVVDIRLEGNSEYYSDFWSYEAGKIKRVGNIQFYYYSDFWSYESGKVKKIGNIDFSYYSDFNSYESGKLKKVGSINFTYYSNFNSYESGKIKRIGSTNFSYYSNFNSYETGKIKTIGSNHFTYYSDRNNFGQLKSGNTNIKDGNINFQVIVRKKGHRPGHGHHHRR